MTFGRLRDEYRLLEDDAILALNKPTGISVMGERHGSDIASVAKDAAQELYPVHRIDKVTSGLVLFAKQLQYHGELTRQFNKRTVTKSYLAITRSKGLPRNGTIDLPLCTGRKNRVRVAAERDAITRDGDSWSVGESGIFTHAKVYPSRTEFTKLWENRRFSLLEVRPVSGRRHQIRVHLAWIGHAIHNDPLFTKEVTGRTLLHSWRLSIAAPGGQRRMDLEATPHDDFWEPVQPIDVPRVLSQA